ncbi:MAG TPA: S9 family peptidase [candidate division Zixibacteria bacterium]|nr:S9 family peptidase [candidate division Zixibacteria bacterium]
MPSPMTFSKNCRAIILCLLIAVVAMPSIAQNAKRPFTFEDLMKLKRIGDFAVSPDGKWVTFTAVNVSLPENTRTPHLWIVPVAGGQERQLTNGKGEDRLRFAPDVKSVLFTTSTKTGESQIFVQGFDPTAGTLVGAPRQVTNISTEADGAIWSPDGKQILFVSAVYPECKDDACNRTKDEEKAKSKVKASVFTHLMYRHWNSYANGKRSHLFLVDAACDANAAGAVVCAGRDLTPGDHDVPPFSLGGQDQYQFSPDGKEIAFASNLDEVEATSTNSDVFILSLADPNAKPINLTAENHGSDSTPMYSPDGRWIAIRSQFRGGYESDRFRLRLVDREKELLWRAACGHNGNKPTAGAKCTDSTYITNLTEQFDRWIDSMTWAPDSKSLFVTAGNHGEDPIYPVSIDGKLSEKIPGADTLMPRAIVDGSNDSPIFTRDGNTIVFVRSSVRFPATLFAFDMTKWKQWASLPDCMTGKPACPEKPQAAQLTHVNDAVLAEVQMQPAETFWFKGAKGEKVQGWLVKPPDFEPNKKYPLKFVVHGGPEVPTGDEWTFRWNPNLFAAPGYVVIEINFHGSPGYGQAFVDSINGDWGGAPFQDLMLGLDYAEKTYPFIDKERECALGASYGGYMANWLLGHTTRFKCIVSHDGMFNPVSAYGTTEELWFNEWEFKGTPWTNPEMYAKWSPAASAKNFKTPTLVVHGQLDYRLDVSEGFQLFTTLQRLGVPSKMLYFPDEGHWVLKPQNSQLWYKTVNDWCDQWTQAPSRAPLSRAYREEKPQK